MATWTVGWYLGDRCNCIAEAKKKRFLALVITSIRQHDRGFAYPILPPVWSWCRCYNMGDGNPDRETDTSIKRVVKCLQTTSRYPACWAPLMGSIALGSWSADLCW